ncbi:MAG: hypothetical protein U0R26_11515 [Solirubrobacterales bacterium]
MEPIDDAWREEVTRRFHDEHEHEYGNAFRDRGLVIVNVAVRGVGVIEGFEFPSLARASGPAEPIGERDVWFKRAGGFLATKIFDRETLFAGHSIEGPAIIAQEDSTTVVSPGAVLTVDEVGNMLVAIEPEGAEAATVNASSKRGGIR